MQTLLLSGDDVQSLMAAVGKHRLMDELIARLHTEFADFDASVSEIPPRSGFYYDDPHCGLIEWMPFFRTKESVLMKMVGYHPENPLAHRLATILSTVSVFDCATGHLSAILDGTLMTAMRTGAASAVASSLLADPNSQTLGLIGCGAQAVTQLHALSRRFLLQRVYCYDVDAAAARSLAARAHHLCPEASVECAALQKVVESADILCVATSIEAGGGPVFRGLATHPWLHVNAVGSDIPGKVEIPCELLETAFVCPDNVQQAQREGECQQLSEAEIGADLTEVARRPDEFKGLRKERTVFDSTGWALEDFAATEVMLEYARELRLGTRMAIESISDDPRDPYAFLGESLTAADQVSVRRGRQRAS